MSGFFLLHDNVAGAPVFPRQLQSIFDLSNSSGGVGARCAAALGGADDSDSGRDEDEQPSEDQVWKCMFAQYAFAHSAAPTFVENSALDAFQTGCILTAEYVAGFPNQTGAANGNCSSAPGWRNCSNAVESCSGAQMVTMDGYMDDFVAALRGANGRLAAAGNGAFVHSCHTHCEALSGPWKDARIGNVSMSDAVKAWWRADTAAPAAEHTYLPCRYHTDAGEAHRCNPTCKGG